MTSEKAPEQAFVPIAGQFFDSKNDWVARGRYRLTSHPDYHNTEHDGPAKGWRGAHFTALCFDQKGRRVRNGGDFQRAEDDGAFPVYWVWPDQIDGLLRADAAQPTVGEMGDEIVRLTDRIQRHQGEIGAAYADAAERAKVHTLGLDKVRADRLVDKIVGRTPADARAALAEAERKAWEAGRDAAASELVANWGHIATPEMRDAIAALKKETQG